jgi:3-hydroxybutyryl-CoA dehydrogenase
MIERIAVVGAGYMGGGIAQVFAMAGLNVVIVDADPASPHAILIDFG